MNPRPHDALTGRPELALGQFLLPFDHQDASGALPDSVTHSEILRNFVKPPVHGWALARLPARDDLSIDELTHLYGRVERWTRFWLEHRRAPGQKLPHYHHGTDNGWGNSTAFDPARTIVSADLVAFLVLRLHELGQLAGLLNRTDEAAQWRKQAGALQQAMIEQLWTGDRFHTRGADGSPGPEQRRSS
ncbi:MGH1-like glycoside hydrolase domain-containing protein [Streptomyces sp. NPDC002690]